MVPLAVLAVATLTMVKLRDINNRSTSNTEMIMSIAADYFH